MQKTGGRGGGKHFEDHFFGNQPPCAFAPPQPGRVAAAIDAAESSRGRNVSVKYRKMNTYAKEGEGADYC